MAAAPAPPPPPRSAGAPSFRAVATVFCFVLVLVAAVYLAWLVRRVIGLVGIAIFLAVALGPPVDLLVRRGLRRTLAIIAVYFSMLGAVVLVGLVVVPPVVSQVEGLAADIPGYLDDLRHNKTFREYDNKYHITEKLQDQASTLPSRLGSAASTLQSVTVGVFSALVQLVTVLTITFFLLLDGKRIVEFLFGLLPRSHEPRVRAIAQDVYAAVSGYVAGNVLISLVAGTIAYVTLTILGVPFAAPLAVLVGFLDLIPLVGATIAALIVGVVTAFSDFPTATIVWAIVSVLYQQLENNLIQPLVYRQTVNVSPLVVIVSILIGSALLGVLGALLAIPIAAAIQIVVLDIWGRRPGRVALPDGLELEAARPDTAAAPGTPSPS